MSFLIALAIAATAHAHRLPGWLGFYHPFNGTVFAADGIPEGTTESSAFQFGVAAISGRTGKSEGITSFRGELLAPAQELRLTQNRGKQLRR